MKIGQVLLVVTAALAALASFYFARGCVSKKESKVWDLVVPNSPKLLNPDSSKPMNPEFAVEDFKKVYQAILAFRQRTGNLPRMRDIWDRNGNDPSKLPLQALTAPDQGFADYNVDENKPVYMLETFLPRPDKLPRPAYPKDGDRDVWCWTDIYRRHYTTVLPNGLQTRELKGVYVVLWSDGVIEKVPTDEILNFKLATGESTRTFKGQAGLNLKEAYSDRDLYLKMQGVLLLEGGQAVAGQDHKSGLLPKH